MEELFINQLTADLTKAAVYQLYQMKNTKQDHFLFDLVIFQKQIRTVYSVNLDILSMAKGPAVQAMIDTICNTGLKSVYCYGDSAICFYTNEIPPKIKIFLNNL
jgi:thiamine biosynthesis lipoprotein ApbE